MGRLILPSVYWGNIEYFARLVAAEEAVIDLGEHYIKRSERNRTAIMTANGVMSLSVPLVRANRPQTPVTDLRIDYSTRWQHRHWTAILSAYRSSPYFDLVAERVERFYRREWKFLVDYDMELQEEIFRLLGVAPKVERSDAYVVAGEQDMDLRPKHRESDYVTPEYFQPFSDRMPFVPNLSVLDVLMSEGLSTADFLASSL
jgi:hypothetical protein